MSLYLILNPEKHLRPRIQIRIDWWSISASQPHEDLTFWHAVSGTAAPEDGR